ncbi:MAG TPA: BTAD domain-containing putative transcriptional regulator [Aldersonia sp.]
MLSIAVLGPVEVRRDGRPLRVPSGKPTGLLVRLALEAGTPVSADRLIEDLWRTDAIDVDRNTLQSKVSQLRRALGDPALLARGARGYTLVIDPDCVDAARAIRLAAQADEHHRSGNATAALAVADDGLALFRGEILAGDGDWLVPHRTRLEEVRCGLLEVRAAARVGLGAGSEVIADLEVLVAEHPLREGLWHTLVTALYRTGRQAEALAACARVRALLRDELGLEPGPELRTLEQDILRQTVPVPNRPRAAAGNLPALSSPLIGRSADLADVVELVGLERLVTLVGPAGVGKTRLAVEVAHGVDVSGGRWLVRLDEVDPVGSILEVIARTLQVQSERALIDRMAETESLLVLDNCEHVVAAAAAAISRLLDSAPRLRVLATSQRPLGLDGEHVQAVAPLPLEDSVRLFGVRAAAARQGFSADAATVESVCRALDGLPLAIELAAARVRSLSVLDIARRLDDRFALLSDPTSSRAPRRRALSAALTWSYDLLVPDDQRGLWALACFAGGAELAAAERVLDALGVPGSSALDVVDRLVDRSLAAPAFLDDGTTRYRLLDSVRAFALDRLRSSGCDAAAFAAHAHWYAERADWSAASVRGVAQPDCVSFVRGEQANIDAALDWCARHDPALGVRIANGFGWAWVVLGAGVQAATRVRGALDAAALPDPDPARARSLLLAGWLEASAGDVDRAERELADALDQADRLDDAHLRADALRHQAFLRLMQGRPAEARALAARGASGDEWQDAANLLLGASAALQVGDLEAARADATAAVGALTWLGDSWGLVHGEAILGAIAQTGHRFDAAARHLEAAATAAERLGFAGQAAYHRTRLGRILQQAGDDAAASAMLVRALNSATGCGDLRMAATARIHLARVLGSGGRRNEAVELLRANAAWYRHAGGGDGALLTRVLLASMTDDPDELTAVLDLARSASDVEAAVLTLDALARIAANRGDRDAAADLLRRADRLVPNAPQIVDADRVDAHAVRARTATQTS